MQPTQESSPDRRHVGAWGLWLLKIVLALLGLGGALINLAGLATTVAEFDLIGFGQWFRYLNGLCLLFGSVLLLIPSTAGFGAAALCAVCVGAFFAQLFVLHGDLIHTIVPAILLAFIAFWHREQFVALLRRFASRLTTF